jgi:hypothetical protein
MKLLLDLGDWSHGNSLVFVFCQNLHHRFRMMQTGILMVLVTIRRQLLLYQTLPIGGVLMQIKIAA